MHFLRQHPMFATLMAAALLALLLLGASIVALAIANHRARVKLKQRQHDLRTLAAAGLLLNEAEAKLAAENVAKVEQENAERLARISTGSKPNTESDAAAPATPTDAFFELAAFVERMAAQGRAFGVKMAADEHFGFAAYAKSGPDQGSIPAVLKQQATVERVLTHLFAAHPEQLVSVARERLPASGSSQSNSTSVGAASAELFVASPLHTARVEGEIGTVAIRVAFVGETAVLRNFLNAMSSHDPRLLVRSVEVEPADNAASSRGAAERQSHRLASAIAQRTKFTVVVEAFEFLREPVPQAISS